VCAGVLFANTGSYVGKQQRVPYHLVAVSSDGEFPLRCTVRDYVALSEFRLRLTLLVFRRPGFEGLA
jgi:hypothetical protein